MNAEFDHGFNKNDTCVNFAELLVSTDVDTDDLIGHAVRDVMALLRKRVNKDVIFVAEFVDGQRVFRQVNSQQLLARKLNKHRHRDMRDTKPARLFH